LLGSIPLLVASSCATAAEFRLLTSAAIKLALNELVPRFESVSGHKVLLQYDTSAGVRKRIDAGEPFDVSVTTVAATDELIKSGRLLPQGKRMKGVLVAI
jgi:ABC-type molybdate transport system substrate-binding protein